MTLLTSLARAAAASDGRARPTKTVRHVHLSGRPLVLAGLQLAGEACAPLAVLAGDDREKPRLIVVDEPRNRGQRFEFAADLAAILLPYLSSYEHPSEQPSEKQEQGEQQEQGDPERIVVFPDAPQLLVPNPGTVSFLRLLGRSTRFRRTEGEYAVAPEVPLLGRWLTYFWERTEVTPSALLLPMTAVLADHWATGQSATEDANLGALLGWIDPPDGATGSAAARAAEDPAVCPPAGPVTDPAFDNDVLEPAIAAIRTAEMAGVAVDRARAELEAALRSQLEPTWHLMWRAIDLLRALPEAGSVPGRWQEDRKSFTSQVGWIRGGGAPQARRDDAVAAARRLARLEREQQRLALQRAYDDRLVMAEYRLTGEAFAGTVTEADPARLTVPASGKKPLLRPWITVATDDEVLFEPGAALRSPDRPKQDVRVIGTSQQRQGGPTLVILEIQNGLGKAKVAPSGTIPAVGDAITYTSLRDEFRRTAPLPDKQDTPWTHGGPPKEYVPTLDDAREDWS